VPTPAKFFIALLAAAVFLPFLGRRDVVTSHEARVAQTARAMAQSGLPWSAKPATVPGVHLAWSDADADGVPDLRLAPDPDQPALHVNPWLVPVLNDEIRLQKPPLPYWCTAALFLCFNHGEWSETLARLFPALLGALATFLIYDLAKRALGRRFAAPAAFAWVTSYFIPDEFRKSMADPYLAFFALAAIAAWVRAATGTRRPAICVIAVYVATGLGLLAKGPPLFVHLIPAILLFHLTRARGRRRVPGTILAHAAGLALMLAIALPWPIYVINHVPHAVELWRYESVGEMTDNAEKAKQFWFYLPQLFQVTLPWTLVWLLGTWTTVARGNRRRRALFPLAWLATVVLIFSFSHVKKNAYLLPSMPAQTLIIAQGLVALAALCRRKYRLSRRAFNDALAAASTLLVVAILAYFQFIELPRDNARSPRLACHFIQWALRDDPNTTVMPSKLPPEATLYLPVTLDYSPRAHTVLYLLDDPRGESRIDLESFAKRAPTLNLLDVARVPIPGDVPRPRYKLFRLITTAGTPKAVATIN
jgi:4-amino-4-deoxy-L-arabinose transferase-like glycosyltransferase